MQPDSLAYALQQALHDMAESGETERRYQYYMQQVSQTAAVP
ncbi:hypothetical protein [Shewanella algae]|nr:hypothetical protein [Shewanella algae]